MHITRRNGKKIALNWKSVIIVFVIIILYNPILFAQGNGGEMFYIADDYIDNENFTGAINLYKRMLDEDPNNAELNFKLGFCYLNTAHEKDKAIEYIEKSVKQLSKRKRRRSTEYLEASFYLAKAYQANYKFDKALTQYTELKEKTKNKQLISVIDAEIAKCAEGNALIQNPVQLTITNLGDSINSEYGDHSPFVSADESVLVFTSRRENKYNDEMDISGEYDENIFIAYKDEETGKWSKPESIGDSINTADHEASISISVDGQKLFIYKSEDEGSIFVSDLVGDVWSKPKKLGPQINTKYRETDASLSSDGMKLYFTSDRKGGYGGLDIYVSYKLLNGEWGEAKNLGPTINTPQDERAPFIHPDDITIYFSSKGHGGLGGFDIFSSQLNEFGTWTKPENIGYPINTSSDDIFYVTSADRQRSYYASSKESGFGMTDIYMIGLQEEEVANITIMTGKVYICRGNLPEVSITVMDAKTDEVVGIYTPNSKSGKFLFVLNKGGRYNVVFEADGKIINEEQLYVPENAAYQQLYKAVQIPVNPPCNDEELAMMEEQEFAGGVNIDNIDENGIVYDSNIKVENILFPSNQAKLMESNSSLNKLAEYLRENPGAIIEIGAYADASGRAAYNYLLSFKRGQAIKDYLVKRKVKPEQAVVVGYGEENPIALNKDANGTWNKEGQKYNRRIEFKVIQQGNSTLLVKPIMNIPAELKNKDYERDYKKDPNKHIETQI
jgi:outer membrane protein OmpA-like peptidoglycan-associated protein